MPLRAGPLASGILVLLCPQHHDSLIKSRRLKSWKQAGECCWVHIWLSSSVLKQGFHFPSCRKSTQHQAPKPDNGSVPVPSCLGAVRSRDLAFAHTIQVLETIELSSHMTEILQRLLGKSRQLNMSPCVASHFLFDA